ncbi:uncharacterized protein FIBRA_07632 [Fibroporia radiculosa]|uniref:F-box domain-containing protein n=1 Tax=Fibroporia radiculosa TaxID=599839 RepID=J4GVD2_9APHY|nr:uncharacterized protein FIBRA_07632 [Fibroporia radiculosa]CCM05415.1 predicted protein [Fibroporia radiculosa]
MALSLVPIELLLEILSLALDQHPCPSNILSVDKSFAALGGRVLYSHLHFRTVRQLILFSEQTARPACLPKSIVLALAGVQRHLSGQGLTPSIISPPRYVQTLQAFCGDMTSCPFLRFQIVPAATFYLFRAIRTWSNIAHITLTNLSFPSDDLGIHAPLSRNMPLLPAIPTLRTLTLGQATLLPPSAVAAMICLPGQEGLEMVRLIDAYSESIWGPRIRRRDVEKAAVMQSRARREDTIVLIRRIVRCEARTERTMGGDRAEESDNFILE